MDRDLFVPNPSIYHLAVNSFLITAGILFVFAVAAVLNYIQRFHSYTKQLTLVRDLLTGKHGRHMEPNEARFEHVQRSGGSSLFSVAVFVESRELLEPEELLGALKRVTTEHAMLEMKIQGTAGKTVEEDDRRDGYGSDEEHGDSRTWSSPDQRSRPPFGTLPPDGSPFRRANPGGSQAHGTPSEISIPSDNSSRTSASRISRSETHGFNGYGSRSDRPRSHGTRANESRAHVSRSHGTRDDGSRTDRSRSNETRANGSETERSRSGGINGSRSNENRDNISRGDNSEASVSLMNVPSVNESRADGSGDNASQSSPDPNDFLYFEEIENCFADVDVLETDDWKLVMEEDLLKPFDSSTGPLWRVKMLNDRVEGRFHERALVFTFHHAIADGLSTMKFLNQLMDELSREVPFTAPRYTQRMNQSYARFLGDENMGLTALQRIRVFLKYHFDFSFSDCLPPQPPCSLISLTTFFSPPRLSTHPKTNFVFFKLLPDELDALLRRCRVHNCKLHGTLQAVVSMAQVRMLRLLLLEESQEPPPLIKIRNHYTESVRGFKQPPLLDTIFGLYSQGRSMSRTIETDEAALEKSFWDLAKSMSDEVHRRQEEWPVEQNAKDNAYVFETFPECWLEEINPNAPEDFDRDSVTADYMMSNYGKFFDRQAARRRFEVSAVYWGSNCGLGDFAFNHQIVTVRGTLLWTIGFAENIFAEAQGNLYAECVQEALRKAVEGRYETVGDVGP